MKRFIVTWSIDCEADSPRDAAERVWQQHFQRSLPAEHDDCCVFSVREGALRHDKTPRPAERIDLAIPEKKD